VQFVIASKSVPWNALEVMKIDHKFYLQQIATSCTSRRLLQLHFGYEFQCLKMCLQPIDIVYDIFYDLDFDYFNATCNGLQIP
jgi:hypothetical protein